jgi:hypothetical protein
VAGKAALAPTLLVTPAIIDPRRVKLHRPRSHRELALPAATIAHDQGMALFVSLAAMAFEIIVDLSLQRFDQHPPCTFPRDLVQSQNFLARFPLIPLLDYFQHGWRLPSNPATTGRLRLLTLKGTPPFSCAHQIHNFW